jgi:hypothetical protein
MLFDEKQEISCRLNGKFLLSTFRLIAARRTTSSPRQTSADSDTPPENPHESSLI